MLPYETFFNGDVTKQCEAGTYPQHRDQYVQHLGKSVQSGVLSHESATERLKTADALWQKHLDSIQSESKGKKK